MSIPFHPASRSNGESARDAAWRRRATRLVVAAVVLFGSVTLAMTAVAQGLPAAEGAELQASAEPLVSHNPIPTKNLLQVIRDGGALIRV